MPLKIKVFTSEPPCSGGRLVRRLVEEIKKEYEDKIDLEYYLGLCDEAKKYELQVSPAIIIDEDIRIIGVCPTKRTLKDAIREAGF